MIRVFCTKCSNWYVDAASCDCDRPRLRAADVRPARLSRRVERARFHTDVLLTAAALEPRSLAEMQRAIVVAARTIAERN